MRSNSAIVGLSESIWIASVLVVILFLLSRSCVFHCVYITPVPRDPSSIYQGFIKIYCALCHKCMHSSAHSSHHSSKHCSKHSFMHSSHHSSKHSSKYSSKHSSPHCGIYNTCIRSSILSCILPNIIHTPGMGDPIQPRQLLT